MMEDVWFEQIEQYLSGDMSSNEKAIFEKELATNQELFSVYTIYSGIETEMFTHEKYALNEGNLKKTLQSLNLKYFNLESPKKSENHQSAKIVKVDFRSVYKYIALIAASIVIALGVYFIVFQSAIQTPQELAKNYIETLRPSQQMASSQDSLRIGFEAYNNKVYNKALLYFQNISKNHPDNSEVKKYIGLVYLNTKEYDKALKEFRGLAEMKNLYSNPGMFLEAATLLIRNNKGDKEQAKQLLQRVVDEKAEGSKEAEEWLKKL